MDLQQIIQSLSEAVATKATVKNVYGDPVTAEGKTVIPVARIQFGFGAGGGSGDKGEGQKGEGGGAGGGVKCTPAGILEISAGETRWIPIHDYKRLAAVLAAGFTAAWLLAKCCRRHCGHHAHCGHGCHCGHGGHCGHGSHGGHTHCEHGKRG